MPGSCDPVARRTVDTASTPPPRRRASRGGLDLAVMSPALAKGTLTSTSSTSPQVRASKKGIARSTGNRRGQDLDSLPVSDAPGVPGAPGCDLDAGLVETLATLASAPRARPSPHYARGGHGFARRGDQAGPRRRACSPRRRCRMRGESAGRSLHSVRTRLAISAGRRAAENHDELLHRRPDHLDQRSAPEWRDDEGRDLRERSNRSICFLKDRPKSRRSATGSRSARRSSAARRASDD